MTENQKSQREIAAREICAVLGREGYRAFLAGGCVRDFLLQTEARDVDIATDARPDRVRQLFPKAILVGARFGVVTVPRPEGHFEVATFRVDGPYRDGRHPDSVTFTEAEEDARRRDFTINALFLDPASDTILDYVGGRADIEAGIVRAVGDPEARFREDRLRLLRAVRFAARLGFVIEAETFRAIQGQAPCLRETSAERIRDELVKMLTEGSARRAFELLDESGLLEQALPEIARMKGIEQPEGFHPEGDVFVHTLCALGFLPENASCTLAMGVLLHDVGKPVTQSFEDRIRFNLHEKAGARIAETICLRLRMSSFQTQRIVWLVENHMRLKDFFKMREYRRKRLARREGFDELVELCRVDALASHGDTEMADAAAAYKAGLGEEELQPKPLLTGSDLISLGYPPGPVFKEILDAVEKRQLEGTLDTREVARDYVCRRWPRDGR